MSDKLNLAEIEARAKAAHDDYDNVADQYDAHRIFWKYMGQMPADVQALLAEVRRLRGELAAAEYMDAEGDAWGPGIMAQE